MIGLFLTFLLFSSTVLAQDCAFCPVPYLGDFLSHLYPQSPLELIEVKKIEYKKNLRAEICTRPLEMVDTLVLHHSETTPETTPLTINRYHLNRGTPTNPWYMIAYNFVLNSPYSEDDELDATVTEGRPLEVVGAHAGTNVFVPMDKVQQKLWDEGKVLCAEGLISQFKVDPSYARKGSIKANVTTISLVVNGNYSPRSNKNPGGYSKSRPRFPTKSTLDMIARLACQLQMKYPRMKYIKSHNFYTQTLCPGNIEDTIGEIKTMAKEYGCEFQ